MHAGLQRQGSERRCRRCRRWTHVPVLTRGVGSDAADASLLPSGTKKIKITKKISVALGLVVRQPYSYQDGK